MAKGQDKKKSKKGKLKVKTHDDEKVANIGHNSDNLVERLIEERLECDRQVREIAKVRKSINAEAKDNNISIVALNHVIRVRKMDEEVAANFMQDTRILFEATGMQESFEFADKPDHGDAPDPLEAAQAAEASAK